MRLSPDYRALDRIAAFTWIFQVVACICIDGAYQDDKQENEQLDKIKD